MAQSDDTSVNDDAGSHPLNRHPRKNRGRRRRFGRGLFHNGLGRGHHGKLGGGLLTAILGLITAIIGRRKKTVGRGGAHHGAGRQRKPRKGKIVRHRAQKGIRRPPAVRQPRSPGAVPRRPGVTFVTGVLNVATGRLQRRRLLG